LPACAPKHPASKEHHADDQLETELEQVSMTPRTLTIESGEGGLQNVDWHLLVPVNPTTRDTQLMGLIQSPVILRMVRLAAPFRYSAAPACIASSKREKGVSAGREPAPGR